VKGLSGGRRGGRIGPLRVLLLAGLFLLPGLAAASGCGGGEGGGGGECGAAAREPDYILSILPVNATKYVDPTTSQKSATFGFQVKNNGGSGFLILELYPWPVGNNWSYNFLPSVPFELSPGETGTVFLVLYPAADAEAKRYTFNIRGNETGATANSISINLDIRQFAGVHLDAPPPQSGDPGNLLRFDFTIVNTGNGKDRFNVTSVTASVLSINPALEGQDSWTATLAPGERAVKRVRVQLPFDIRPSGGTDGVQLSMSVASERDPGRQDTNSTVLRVNQTFGLSLGVAPPSASLLPGQQAVFTVSVVNLGNGDDTVTLGVRAVFPSSSWTFGFGKDRLAIAPGRLASTDLRVTPPHNALAGDTYIALLTARSSGPPGKEFERTEEVRLAVLPVRGITVPQEHFPSPHPVEPGRAVQFPFGFTNSGNAPRTVLYEVSEAPAGWDASVEPERADSVRPGASAGAVLRVEPSPDFNRSPAGTHLVRVRLSDPELGPLRELVFEVEVAPVRGLELEPMGGPAREVNLFVSNRLTVLFTLGNTGNAPDEATVALAGDFAAWGRFDTSFVPVSPGELKVVRLDITVPGSAVTVSIYPIIVRASSLGRPDLVVERILFVTVRDLDPAELWPRLRVHPRDRSITLTGGEGLTFPVSVLCTGSDIGNVTLRITGAEELGLAYQVTELPRDLRAGENHTFLVLLRPSGPTGAVTKGTLTIQAVGEGVSAEPQTVTVTLQPAPRGGPVVSMEGLGMALAVFLVLGGLALGWNEVVLVAMLNLLLPVYVKLRREEVLDQYTRGKIHGYIIANPGEHYNSIKAQLRLKNGTLAYHLRVLEREGYVKTTRDGMFKRFYPDSALLPRRRSEFSAIQEIVLENVRSSPGITQNELARRMGVSSQVVNYHIRNLVAAGAVRLDREGRLTRCYLN